MKKIVVKHIRIYEEIDSDSGADLKKSIEKACPKGYHYKEILSFEYIYYPAEMKFFIAFEED